MAMKDQRDKTNEETGRALVVVKSAVVDAELDKLNLNLRSRRGSSRMVSMDAYDAGGAAGASLSINPALKRA